MSTKPACFYDKRFEIHAWGLPPTGFSDWIESRDTETKVAQCINPPWKILYVLRLF